MEAEAQDQASQEAISVIPHYDKESLKKIGQLLYNKFSFKGVLEDFKYSYPYDAKIFAFYKEMKKNNFNNDVVLLQIAFQIITISINDACLTTTEMMTNCFDCLNTLSETKKFAIPATFIFTKYVDNLLGNYQINWKNENFIQFFTHLEVDKYLTGSDFQIVSRVFSKALSMNQQTVFMMLTNVLMGNSTIKNGANFDEIYGMVVRYLYTIDIDAITLFFCLCRIQTHDSEVCMIEAIVSAIVSEVTSIETDFSDNFDSMNNLPSTFDDQFAINTDLIFDENPYFEKGLHNIPDDIFIFIQTFDKFVRDSNLKDKIKRIATLVGQSKINVMETFFDCFAKQFIQAKFYPCLSVYLYMLNQCHNPNVICAQMSKVFESQLFSADQTIFGPFALHQVASAMRSDVISILVDSQIPPLFAELIKVHQNAPLLCAELLARLYLRTPVDGFFMFTDQRFITGVARTAILLQTLGIRYHNYQINEARNAVFTFMVELVRNRASGFTVLASPPGNVPSFSEVFFWFTREVSIRHVILKTIIPSLAPITHGVERLGPAIGALISILEKCAERKRAYNELGCAILNELGALVTITPELEQMLSGAISASLKIVAETHSIKAFNNVLKLIVASSTDEVYIMNAEDSATLVGICRDLQIQCKSPQGTALKECLSGGSFISAKPNEFMIRRPSHVSTVLGCLGGASDFDDFLAFLKRSAQTSIANARALAEGGLLQILTKYYEDECNPRVIMPQFDVDIQLNDPELISELFILLFAAQPKNSALQRIFSMALSLEDGGKVLEKLEQAMLSCYTIPGPIYTLDGHRKAISKGHKPEIFKGFTISFWLRPNLRLLSMIANPFRLFTLTDGVNELTVQLNGTQMELIFQDNANRTRVTLINNVAQSDKWDHFGILFEHKLIRTFKNKDVAKKSDFIEFGFRGKVTLIIGDDDSEIPIKNACQIGCLMFFGKTFSIPMLNDLFRMPRAIPKPDVISPLTEKRDHTIAEVATGLGMKTAVVEAFSQFQTIEEFNAKRLMSILGLLIKSNIDTTDDNQIPGQLGILLLKCPQKNTVSIYNSFVSLMMCSRSQSSEPSWIQAALNPWIWSRTSKQVFLSIINKWGGVVAGVAGHVVSSRRLSIFSAAIVQFSIMFEDSRLTDTESLKIPNSIKKDKEVFDAYALYMGRLATVALSTNDVGLLYKLAIDTREEHIRLAYLSMICAGSKAASKWPVTTANTGDVATWPFILYMLQVDSLPVIVNTIAAATAILGGLIHEFTLPIIDTLRKSRHWGQLFGALFERAAELPNMYSILCAICWLSDTDDYKLLPSFLNGIERIEYGDLWYLTPLLLGFKHQDDLVGFFDFLIKHLAESPDTVNTATIIMRIIEDLSPAASQTGGSPLHSFASYLAAAELPGGVTERAIFIAGSSVFLHDADRQIHQSALFMNTFGQSVFATGEEDIEIETNRWSPFAINSIADLNEYAVSEYPAHFAYELLADDKGRLLGMSVANIALEVFTARPLGGLTDPAAVGALTAVLKLMTTKDAIYRKVRSKSDLREMTIESLGECIETVANERRRLSSEARAVLGAQLIEALSQRPDELENPIKVNEDSVHGFVQQMREMQSQYARKYLEGI